MEYFRIVFSNLFEDEKQPYDEQVATYDIQQLYCTYFWMQQK